MRGKKAKKLRKKIYGSEFSPRKRRYMKNNKTGAIFCAIESRRQQYQQLKKKAE